MRHWRNLKRLVWTLTTSYFDGMDLRWRFDTWLEGGYEYGRKGGW